jgi:hypothetical protein
MGDCAIEPGPYDEQLEITTTTIAAELILNIMKVK